MSGSESLSHQFLESVQIAALPVSLGNLIVSLLVMVGLKTMKHTLRKILTIVSAMPRKVQKNVSICCTCRRIYECCT